MSTCALRWLRQSQDFTLTPKSISCRVSLPSPDSLIPRDGLSPPLPALLWSTCCSALSFWGGIGCFGAERSDVVMLPGFHPIPGAELLPGPGRDGTEACLGGRDQQLSIFMRLQRSQALKYSSGRRRLLVPAGRGATWLKGAGSHPWPPLSRPGDVRVQKGVCAWKHYIAVPGTFSVPAARVFAGQGRRVLGSRRCLLQGSPIRARALLLLTSGCRWRAARIWRGRPLPLVKGSALKTNPILTLILLTLRSGLILG